MRPTLIINGIDFNERLDELRTKLHLNINSTFEVEQVHFFIKNHCIMIKTPHTFIASPAIA